MFTIIHGSHRHGYNWKIVELLKEKLEVSSMEVIIIDLSKLDFEYCCGFQICQEGECIYKNDKLSEIFKKFIIPADGIYVVTPTYFNMPPAKLKSFIDRSNALLPELENEKKDVIFGVWVSGEAELDSIECNKKMLEDYAEIMGWKLVKEINELVLFGENSDVNVDRIEEIAEMIRRNLT